jgi:hypothetical protein
VKFKFTNSSEKVLDEIKNRIINNYADKNPKNFKIKYSKKKYFSVVVVPYFYPAFLLYADGKVIKSYFYKNNKWIEVED